MDTYIHVIDWYLRQSNVVSCMLWFLLHDAVHSVDCAVARYLAIRLFICLSVCLSVRHTGILSKCLNISSKLIHLLVAAPF